MQVGDPDSILDKKVGEDFPDKVSRIVFYEWVVFKHHLAPMPAWFSL